jgi:hypothetical protein
MFYVYFRNMFYASPTDVRRSTLQGAIDAGVAAGKAFDVHNGSGSVAWLWEQRV